jgi:hypothetical protein
MKYFLQLILFLLLSFSYTLSQTVSGRFVTSAYVWERQDTINKSSSHLRAQETVQLDIGKNDLVLHTYFNASNDFGSSITDDPRVRFYNLYLEKKNLFDVVDVKFGRIPIFAGMGVGAIDGAALKVHPFGTDLLFSGYFGGLMPVDQSLKMFNKMSDNYMFGGQISSGILPNTSLSLSYMERHRKPESIQTFRPDTVFNLYEVLLDNSTLEEQNISFDAYYSKEMVSAYGKVDIQNFKLYRGEVSLRYNVMNNIGVSAEFLHREPRVAFNSIFAVFDSKSTDEFGGGVDYLLMNQYNLFARYYYVSYTDDNSSRLSIGVNSSIGSLSYSRNFGYVGTMDVLNAQITYPLLKRQLISSVGFELSSYKFQNDDLQSASALLLGATWRPNNTISLDLQGQMLMNEIYKNDFRIYFKFNYWFLSKLGIF